MAKLNFDHSCAERFLRYVKIDTQSDHNSNSFPSTEKQKDLSRLLVEELKKIGIQDSEMDEHGYVYATIPSNTDKDVPVICFCSHVDTSPDAPGKNVNPQIYKNYQGEDIALINDKSQLIKFSEHPQLKNQIGNDIITTDGTTLLGADDKAGIAEIMDAAEFMIKHPEIKHGKIRILFTPDEEIGHGVDKVDLEKLGAKFGYTMDGETLGEIQSETFSADSLTLTITGFNIHPGFATGRMENAIKIASKIIRKLPKKALSPESTKDMEGFIHPVSINGTVDEVIIKFIIRDFNNDGLKEKANLIRKTAEKVIEKFKSSSFKVEIEEQYRNMKQIIDKNPEMTEYAMEAVRRTGVEPKLTSIRGGTDGSRLSYMGLPCPNIFAGGHAFHSKQEWISVQDMEKAAETIVHLCMIWEERS